jgi:hypothetical protein
MKHIPGKLNKGHDALSVLVQGKAEHGQEVQDNIADRIEPTLQQILVEQDLNESVPREYTNMFEGWDLHQNMKCQQRRREKFWGIRSNRKKRL